MAYCRLVHRLKITGRENIPKDLSGPLVVISNHTGGLDPVFLQLGIQRPWIRWMMADDMRMPLLDLRQPENGIAHTLEPFLSRHHITSLDGLVA